MAGCGINAAMNVDEQTDLVKIDIAAGAFHAAASRLRKLADEIEAQAGFVPPSDYAIDEPYQYSSAVDQTQ
jgi:hypothetical protein